MRDVILAVSRPSQEQSRQSERSLHVSYSTEQSVVYQLTLRADAAINRTHLDSRVGITQWLFPGMIFTSESKALRTGRTGVRNED